MNKVVTAGIVGALLLGQLSGGALAAEDPGVRNELTAVLAAQQLSCGKIVHYDAQGTRDYLVHCQDGSVYQVLANSQGQLVAALVAKEIHPVK